MSGADSRFLRACRKKTVDATPAWVMRPAGRYMIEGGSPRNFTVTKTLLYREPKTWALLMEKLCDVLEPYLLAQVEAGAAAIQIFDSWVGCLAVSDYQESVLPYSRRLIEAVE